MSPEELARRIARNAAVALVTEPLADKEGCTTRTIDCAPTAKLEYFIVGGLNIIWDIYDLALNILSSGQQPQSIFRYAAQAQASSVLSRAGGKITFGQTLLLIPLVAAHALSVSAGRALDDLSALPQYLSATLRSTTSRDVADLQRFCDAALAQSRASNQKMGVERDYPEPRFAGNGFFEAATEPAFTKLFITQEIVTGYPETLNILASWMQAPSQSKGLISFVEDTYPKLLNKFGRFDVAADLIAAGMYLILSAESERELY